MKNSCTYWLLSLAAFTVSTTSGAQDLLITNAHIIDGTGATIDRGFISISDGRIDQIAAGSPELNGTGLVIDAQGMSVMPGFIDTHRHIIGGGAIADAAGLDAWLRDQAPVRMQAFLSAGFTTVQAAGDATAGIVELKRRINDRELAGPRLFVSGARVQPGSADEVRNCRRDSFCRANRSIFSNDDELREAVRELVSAGVDVIKVRTDGNDPTGLDREQTAIVAEEAQRLGVPSVSHATAVNYMIDAVEAGITRLVHTPHTGTLLGTEGAQLVVNRGVPVSSTLGVWVPLFGEANDLRWRNGAPFPPPGVARAGQGPVNARYLWDAGSPLAYGTDTGFHPRDSLDHELRPLSLLFSPIDIVAMLTRNAAIWLDLADDIGTLEHGKIADVVIVNGDPQQDSDALLDVRTVIKDGIVVAVNTR